MKLFRKKKIKAEDKKEKIEKKDVYTKVTEVLPFIDINDNHIILKDGIMDILEIEGKDILSLTDIDLERDINIFHTFYKMISTDIKIVAMNFPVDTTIQKNYIDYKISKTKNNIYKSFLRDKKDELVFLEKHRTNKEYYLFLYAPNIQVLDSVRGNVSRTLTNALNVKELSLEKKQCILFKLCNKTSKINTRGM